MAENEQAAKAEVKPVEKEPIIGEVFVPTVSFDVGPFDDDEARQTFIEDNKLTKAQQETVVVIGKEHVVGTGVTYTFQADGK